MPNQKITAKKQGFVGVFGNEKVELNNELEIVSMISMNQKTTSEEWKKQMSKFYGVMFECGDYEQLVDFISTLIAQKQKEVLEACLPPIKKINGFEVGGYTISREDIIQTAKEKFGIDL